MNSPAEAPAVPPAIGAAPAMGAATAWVSPAFQRLFHEKLVTAEEALRVVKSGDTVYVHPGCAAPQRLLDLMAFDKKAAKGSTRFVLLEGIGRAALRADVNPAAVREAIVAAAR